MPNLRLPIPMLSPLGWGLSSDLGLPDNVHVLAALESFESNVHAIESYKAISLKLRALCASNEEMEQHLELVFEGDLTVSSDQFYVEQERHRHSYHGVSQNTLQHPIATKGRIKSVRYALKDRPGARRSK